MTLIFGRMLYPNILMSIFILSYLGVIMVEVLGKPSCLTSFVFFESGSAPTSRFNHPLYILWCPSNASMIIDVFFGATINQ